VLTSGFVAAKHAIFAFGVGDATTVCIGWLRDDYARYDYQLPNVLEFDKMPEKLDSQRDSYLTQGQVYGLPSDFLTSRESSCEPYEAAKLLYELLQTFEANGTCLAGHGTVSFTAPFVKNFLDWHGFDGSVFNRVQQYDTAVFKKAMCNDIVPTEGEAWDSFSARVLKARTSGRWNLAACAAEFDLVTDPELDVVANNRKMVAQLMGVYRNAIAVAA